MLTICDQRCRRAFLFMLYFVCLSHKIVYKRSWPLYNIAIAKVNVNYSPMALLIAHAIVQMFDVEWWRFMWISNRLDQPFQRVFRIDPMPMPALVIIAAPVLAPKRNKHMWINDSLLGLTRLLVWHSKYTYVCHIRKGTNGAHAVKTTCTEYTPTTNSVHSQYNVGRNCCPHTQAHHC